MATIDSYIESLSNCSGRFRRLAGAYPLTDSEGRPLFTARSRCVTFRIMHDGRRYLLRCPLSMSATEKAMTEKLILEIRHLNNRFIARQDYLPAEMLIFDNHGKPSRADIILEEEPEGEPLQVFLRSRRMLSDKRPVRELLKGLAAMAEELSRGGLIHGNLHHRNIFVSEAGVPVAVNYAMSHDKRELNDTRALALLVLNTFLAGCGSHLWIDGGGTAEDYILNLKHVRTQAEFLRLGPLITITGILLNTGTYAAGTIIEKGSGISPNVNHPVADRMEFNAAAAAIADTSFVPMPLLKSLTEYNTDNEEKLEHDAADSMRKPKPASEYDTADGMENPEPAIGTVAQAPSGTTVTGFHREDTTLRVDFDRCDFVAPMSDTLIRFCIKGRWDFADRYGNPITKACFLDAGDFYEGLAVVATGQGRGTIDRRGRFIMEPTFEMLEWYGHENVIAACADGKWELYDRQGRRLTAGAYDWLGDCSEGTFLARRGNRFGYLLADGNSLTDIRFDDAYSFRNGTATVKSGNEIYKIDKTGRKLP